MLIFQKWTFWSFFLSTINILNSAGNHHCKLNHKPFIRNHCQTHSNNYLLIIVYIYLVSIVMTHYFECVCTLLISRHNNAHPTNYLLLNFYCFFLLCSVSVMMFRIEHLWFCLFIKSYLAMRSTKTSFVMSFSNLISKTVLLTVPCTVEKTF